MLKPMLARGELRMIGATTLDEYRKYVEKDAALERRFQPVLVEPPSVEDTIGILRGLKERYEVHHGVRITDAALVAAAVLVRPLHHRHAICPTRRSTSSTSPPPGCVSRSTRCRRRSTSSSGAVASSRSSKQRPQEGDGRRLRRHASTTIERGARRPRRGARPSHTPIGSSRRTPSTAIRTTKQEIEDALGPTPSEPSAPATSQRPPSCATAPCPSSKQRSARRGRPHLAKLQAGLQDAQGRGRRGGRRRGGQPLDRRPGLSPDGRRDREAHPARGPSPRAGRRPGRGRRPPSPTPSGGPEPGCRTRIAPSARSSSSARPASARPSWPGRWPSSSSTTSEPWCASTCRSTWRSTR